MFTHSDHLEWDTVLRKPLANLRLSCESVGKIGWPSLEVLIRRSKWLRISNERYLWYGRVVRVRLPKCPNLPECSYDLCAHRILRANLFFEPIFSILQLILKLDFYNWLPRWINAQFLLNSRFSSRDEICWVLEYVTLISVFRAYSAMLSYAFFLDVFSKGA